MAEDQQNCRKTAMIKKAHVARHVSHWKLMKTKCHSQHRVQLKRMSLRKLQNSSFGKIESEQGIITREKAKHMGLGLSSQVQHAVGFKLQDAVILSECISTAAICSLCQRAGSKLQLFQRNAEREGLSESLFLRCSFCIVETPLQTSRRLGGLGEHMK